MSKSNPLDRAFHLLDIMACAGREMSLIEIVKASGLPQSSAFRLASNLVESGMLSFDTKSKTYGLGPRARRLGLFLKGAKALEDIVLPSLTRLATTCSETAFFAVRGEDSIRLVSFVVPEVSARAFIHPGFDFPIHASAAGKVIHAFAGSRGISLADQTDLRKFQEVTVTDPKILESVFEEIRSRGYSVNDGELDFGIFAMAAPVFSAGDILGALAVVGPRERMVENSCAEAISNELVIRAAELSALL